MENYMVRVADLISKLRGCSTVYVFAVVSGGQDNASWLKVKVRNTDKSMPLDQVLKDIFGKEFAGAKEGSGAVSLPLGLSGRTPNRIALIQTWRDLLNHIFLK